MLEAYLAAFADGNRNVYGEVDFSTELTKDRLAFQISLFAGKTIASDTAEDVLPALVEAINESPVKNTIIPIIGEDWIEYTLFPEGGIWEDWIDQDKIDRWKKIAEMREKINKAYVETNEGDVQEAFEKALELEPGTSVFIEPNDEGLETLIEVNKQSLYYAILLPMEEDELEPPILLVPGNTKTESRIFQTVQNNIVGAIWAMTSFLNETGQLPKITKEADSWILS